MADPRIVLGIDYGTTYTGLAWMDTTNPDIVNVFLDWPNGRGAAEGKKRVPKVPSAYSYSKTPATGQYRQWGYSISDDSNVMQWTKLELEPRTIVRELEVLRDLLKGLDLLKELRTNEDAAIKNDVPRYLPKDAGDVVREYLGKVAREWYEHMRAQGRYILDNVPIDIVLTHPASWSYEAKNKTYRAVIGAFPRGMFPRFRNVSLTSEPEACALNIVQEMLKKDRHPLIIGECFVLCDAGGGTVDLVSYRTDSIEPLRLTIVGGISGGKCGATFIDRAFLEWLQPKLENEKLVSKDSLTSGHFVVMKMGRILLERFERIKHEFSGSENGDISLRRGTIVREDQQDGIVNGVITLTETNLRNFFEKSVMGTVRLISKQVIQVENSAADGEIPYQVTNIFLAGGLSTNPYLVNEVKNWANARGGIQVQQADDCWTSVVKGAVLRGMGMGMEVAAKVNSCPRHYGICVSQIYAELTDVDRSSRRQVVTEQLVWLVRRGDLILPDEPVVSRFDLECRFTSKHLDLGKSMRIIFVASAIDNPPSRLTELPKYENEVAYLDINLDSIPANFIQRSNRLRDRYYTAAVRLEIHIFVSVRVTVKCGETTLRDYRTSL